MDGWKFSDGASRLSLFELSRNWFIEHNIEDCTPFVYKTYTSLYPVGLWSVMLACLETLSSQLTLLGHLGTRDKYHERASTYLIKTLRSANNLPIAKWSQQLPVLILRSAVAVSLNRCARTDWNVPLLEQQFWATRWEDQGVLDSLTSDD